MSEAAVTGIAAFPISLTYDSEAEFVSAVIKCTPPKETQADIEVPAPISGPDAGKKGRVAGSTALAEVPFQCRYSAAALDALRDIRGVVKTFVLTYADGSTESFTGYVRDVAPDELNDTSTMLISGVIAQTGYSAFTPAEEAS